MLIATILFLIYITTCFIKINRVNKELTNLDVFCLAFMGIALVEYFCYIFLKLYK